MYKLNKQENPIDYIGVEPSDTEVITPDIHSNQTFHKAMQEPNSHPFQTSNTEIRHSGDPDVKRLRLFDNREDNFEEDETIVGVAIHVDSDTTELSPFNGFYLTKGPATHFKLRFEVNHNTNVNLPMYKDSFATRVYVHGFYTNKGRFLNRRQAIRLIEENGLPTLVPVSEMNYKDGCMSTDIWGEEEITIPTGTVHATTKKYVYDAMAGFNHDVATTQIRRQTTVKSQPNGKPIPMSVSEMMREKRMKKNIRKFTGR